MIPTYTPQELEDFELSARDNVADYDPVEYIALVKASADAGKLEDYTLSELQKLEDNVKIAYSSLSNEQMNNHEDIFHQTFESIIDLQNTQEIEEAEAYINTVRQDLNAGLFNSYSFTDLTEIRAGLDRAFGVLPPAKEKAQSQSQLYANLDSTYNKGQGGRALNYVNAISKLAADGSLDSYPYSELQKVEGRLKRAYSALSAEEQEREKERYTQTIMSLTNLQSNTVDGKLHNSINGLLEDHAKDSKKNQSWEGFKPGEYKKAPVVEEKVVPKEEQDTAEYSLAALAADAHEQREPMISPVLQRTVYDEEFSLDALLGKAIVSQMGSPSFKAHCVVEPKGKKGAKAVSEQESIETSSFDNVGSLVDWYELSRPLFEPLFKVEEPAPLATEAAVTPSPARGKSKLVGYLAKAAFVAAAGIASLVGYNHLTSSVPEADPVQHYHGSPVVEVIAPVNKAKHAEASSELPSEAESVDNQSRSVEQPTVAPQAAPSAPRKVIKRFPPSYDPYDDSFHTVEKGDTVGGLYEDYAARGGTLSRSDYFKVIRIANPHLENLSTIYVGQEIKMPQ